MRMIEFFIALPSIVVAFVILFALARTFVFTRAFVSAEAVDLTFVLAPALNITLALAAIAGEATTPPTELAIKPSKIILLIKPLDNLLYSPARRKLCDPFGLGEYPQLSEVIAATNSDTGGGNAETVPRKLFEPKSLRDKEGHDPLNPSREAYFSPTAISSAPVP